MVNFRYHIVSLIAVFVALCLGVVLGAGPLQSRISSGLTPTTSTASSNEALAQAQNNSKIEARAVAELAQGRLAGSLNGVSVAIVTVPGSDSSDVASMRDTLGTAGAQVVGEVELTNTWLSADSATFRNTLATPLASHLTGLAGDGIDEDLLARRVLGLGRLGDRVVVDDAAVGDVDLVRLVLGGRRVGGVDDAGVGLTGLDLAAHVGHLLLLGGRVEGDAQGAGELLGGLAAGHLGGADDQVGAIQR